jgi:hypothetical protein
MAIDVLKSQAGQVAARRDRGLGRRTSDATAHWRLSSDQEEISVKAVHTPWGYAEKITPYPHGIIHYSTASHGGFFVPLPLCAKIPTAVLDKTYNRQGHMGWFEQRSDWCIVVHYFGADMHEPANSREYARRLFEAQFAPGAPPDAS